MMRIEVDFPGNKKVNAKFRNFIVNTDQPIASGGENTAPSPFELFLASLATCAGIYANEFCVKRGINLEKLKIIQEVERSRGNGLLSNVTLNVEVPGDFPEKYKDALIRTVSLCTVKRVIQDPPEFNVTVTSNSH